jgi:hypothetical protein
MYQIHYPYRFKTEEEFIKKYGSNWKSVIGCGWNYYDRDNMNYLFGQPYPFYVNENTSDLPYIISKNSVHNYWRISWDMLTLNEEIKPDYKPKKLIYD